MANYDSSYTGEKIDGSVASSSLYFSGAAPNANISASGYISGSGLFANATSTFYADISSSANISTSGWMSASAGYFIDGYFGGTSLYIGGEHITAAKWQRVERGRKPDTLTVNTFSEGDTTPDISNGSLFKTHGGSSGTTITTFDNGDTGDEITVICSNGNTTISAVSGINTPSRSSLRCATNDTFKFVYDGTNWFTISVSDNS